MADDQITDAQGNTEETPGGSATYGAFHTGKLRRALNAPSGLARFTRPHEKATDNEEIKGPEILNWQLVNASSFAMASGDMKLLHQLMNKDVDRAIVQHFDGDSKSLTLHDAVRGPLESANITSQSSNPGAIGNSHKLTDYLSSTEEPLSPINTKERPTATTKKELRPGERKAEAADKAPAKQKVKDRMTTEVVAEKEIEKRRKGKEAQKNAKELLDKARKKKKVEGKPEVEKPKSKTKGFKPEKPTPEEPEKKISHIPDIPIIWQKGDGSGSSDGLWKEFHDYEHYEMDATDAKSIGDTFPPVNVLLSDWWVGIILQNALGGGDRGKMWPCDFNSKGYIRTSRTPKGRAYKRQFGGSEDVQKWYYIVFYNWFQLHGKEGLDAGKIAVRRKTSTTKKSITRGEMAVLQNDDIPSITPGAAESGDRGIKKIEAKSQVPNDCNLIVTKAKAKDKERLRNNHKDIRKLLQFFAEIKDHATVQLRVLVTSRPEIPIHLGFRAIPGNVHEDFVLHNIAPSVIRHDIAIFLRRDEALLPFDWPGTQKFRLLVERSSGLFIYAATVCRFIHDPRWLPEKRLNIVLQGSDDGQSPEERLDEMYIQILESSVFGDCNKKEKDVLSRRFRNVVGSIIILFDSLSTIVLKSLSPALSESIDISNPC